MASQEENGRSLRPYRSGNLVSPFTEEGLFLRETGTGWEFHLAALETENPFRHAFEQDRSTVIEPEESEEEFEEEYAEEEWADEVNFPADESEIYREEELPDLEYGIEEFYNSDVGSYAETGNEIIPEEMTYLEEETVIPERAWMEPEEEKPDYSLEEAVYKEEGLFPEGGEALYEEEGLLPEEEPFFDEEIFIEPDREEINWPGFEAEKGPEIPAGRLELTRVSLLKHHRGSGPDLILTWNNMLVQPESVDVVIHLHGYSLQAGKLLHLSRDIMPRSGLNWSDPEGRDLTPGRSRPTLALLPRGHFFGGKSGRGYNFPVLISGKGLQQLINFGLDQFARHTGVASIKLRRLIITAHSGGGAAMLKILRHSNPDEVHVFDGLYQNPADLIRWAKARIDRDQKALATGTESPEHYMPDRGGALRVQFRHGTATQRYSLMLHSALVAAIPPKSELSRWYRVEQTSLSHLRIPRAYGWRLLADASAELPNTSTPSRSAREVTYPDEENLYRTPDQEISSSSALRQRIVEVAKREWENWKRGTRSETEQDMKVFLRKYWMNYHPRGLSQTNADGKIASRSPWSAAFISYVMREAGAGDAFAYAALHTSYIAAAKKAALAQEPFKFRAYEISAVRPEIGDLVCRDRASRIGASCAGTTFANVDKGGISHSDIVVEVHQKYAVILGGNTAQTYPNRGKTGDTVGQRKLKLNEQGYVIPDQGKCRYFAIVKPPGHVGQLPGISAPSATIKPAAELVRFAQRVLNATEGERLDVDGKLGPLTRGGIERFRKRYDLGAGGVLDDKTQLALAQRALEEIAQQSVFAQPGEFDAKTEQALKSFKSSRGLGWNATLDAATRSALAEAIVRRLAPASPISGHPRSAAVSGTPVNANVIAAVERYRPIVEAAAAKYGVDSALIRGVIAAESGGNKNLVAKSGYTGLMQSDKGEIYKQPAVSIDSGTKKLRDFRAIMESVLRERGKRYNQLPETEQLRLLALAYNAGPVTVAKALQYAAEAGNPERWLDAEHYKRALLFTGAYSLKQAEASCLRNVSPPEKDSRIREAVRVWNQWRLGTKKMNWRKLDDPPIWSKISASLPSFVVCAIDFKHRNSPKYAEKILAYRNRFQSL
ncbi:DUF2272 domain-containing protein [Methanosarcina sp. MSH10X1]|uniref:DUF2272 domain-containing protein n=1 Tax=Methanosarcina sp. MSH10X1 TaxID=2507075 RepID=UPI000FFB2C0F|nr:DUF2272 domain-containing protein [Methanosarcina sp. MSH10X1]RXA20224.1 DUF2272 domain-containing protein [Methanosarcina sp. MSH10X1]